MTLESSQDRSGYITTFGESVTIGEVTLTAIFDYEYIEASAVESKQPVLTVLSSDVSTAAHGDPVTVRGVSYSIIGIQNDGTGMTDLVLVKS